ncbi:MAG: ADP-ribosylglycohydrolase family protein [Nitrospirae bacterium]|nr:ADP-ribosylglycohydrolase family protein [Nitrospirota bacterium]
MRKASYHGIGWRWINPNLPAWWEAAKCEPNQNIEAAGFDIKTDRITGSVLALALGDAFGAPHEGGILERAVWALIGRQNGRRRWTDDTQMAIDLIESLAACGRVDQNDLARRFSQSYKWSRGYGPGAAKILKRISRGQSWEEAGRTVYCEGSFGNGGAMRAPVVGLFFADDNEDYLVKAASASAEVTHAHPLGREGAVLIALATALAYNNKSSEEIIERLCQRVEAPEFLSRLRIASRWLQAGSNAAPQTVAAELGNGISAVESCVTAIYLALAFRSSPFNELLGFAIRLRGDVDTIAAMSCAIWGAARGLNALPQALLEQVEQYEHLKAVARSFAEAVKNHPPISGK